MIGVIEAVGRLEGTWDVVRMADFAQRALDVDALVIASTADASAPRLIAKAGLPMREARVVQRSVHRLMSARGTAALRIFGLGTCGDVGADVLSRHGFAELVSAPITVGDQVVGTMSALRREPGGFVDDELLAVFIRHAAVGVSGYPAARAELAVDHLDSLQALDDMLLTVQNFEEVSKTVSAAVARLFGAELTGIMVHDDERGVLQVLPGSFGATDDQSASYQVSTADAYSNAARVFTTGRPYISNDARADPGVLPGYSKIFGVKRLLSLPLLIGGRSIGVLHIANKPTDFTCEDIERADLLTPRIATVVELGRALLSLRQARQREEILARAAVSIASGQSIQQFLPAMLAELCDAVDGRLAALVVPGGKPIIVRNGSVRTDLEHILIDEARGQPGETASVGAPKAAGDSGWAMVHVPVVLREQRVGTLSSLRMRGEPFRSDERQALMRLANLLALAWASERYQQQRARLARLEERQRIADHLHDDVAQLMFAAQLNLDKLLERDDLEAPVLDSVVRVRSLITRCDAGIRSVIHQLSHKRTTDLPHRLEAVVADVEQEFEVAVHTEITATAVAVAKRIPRSAAEALVRVARESLVNAAKHAGPCRVTLTLDTTSDELRLIVLDDGVGVPRRRGDHHGLTSLRRAMHDQGGSLSVSGGAAGGTRITAVVPQ